MTPDGEIVIGERSRRRTAVQNSIHRSQTMHTLKNKAWLEVSPEILNGVVSDRHRNSLNRNLAVPLQAPEGPAKIALQEK